MNVSKNVVGIDIAKRVFQLHSINMETGEIVSLQLKREKFLEHFANRQACLIGMEPAAARSTGRGNSPRWDIRSSYRQARQSKVSSPARTTGTMPGDLDSGATTPRQSGGAQTEEQQAILALHRMRSQLVKFRTARSTAAYGACHRIR